MMADSSSPFRSNRQLPKDLRIGLGCRILECRRLLHLSQRRLAEVTGIQAVRVSKIENGHVSLSLAEAVRLAQRFKISLDALVFGVSANPAPHETLPIAGPRGSALRSQARELEEVGSDTELEVIADLLRKLIAGRKAAASAKATR